MICRWCGPYKRRSSHSFPLCPTCGLDDAGTVMVDLVERFSGHVVYALERNGPIPVKLALELLSA